ncbi:uncharacterized protein LOC111718439 isoform X2 [Eurytemora carolleeae]|uniref:uncharacterized protein LOC111718439 isoform X2 n=1 Tax=Eurytemora carolleeae TaxID=1294199 RepID=UPI000C792115|nr:uncharacterized protein LOC111718439 isoform X2 [Eurytemora carolleeae]|eukprot:XP_023349799.1 uncharacterized protein LOC111718439 isoform X2 [Eurytemora affinis]
MLMSMTVLAISTYALLLLYPSHRWEREGIGSVDGAFNILPDTWSEIGQDEVCTDTEKEKVWNSLPECTPRNILVRVPFPPDPDTIQFIPSLVEVPRCAGTCHQEGQLYHRCAANETSQREIPVIIERVSGQTTEEICTTVKVEIHLSCNCGCRKETCHGNQEFNEKSCSCRCKDAGAMGQCLVQYNKIWDGERCLCRCRPEEWKECNTGFSYDGVYTCQCLPGPPLSASSGIVVTLSVLVVVLLVGVSLMYRKSRNHVSQLIRSNLDKEAENSDTPEPENMVLLEDKVNELKPVNLQKTPEMELTGVN